jgi:hypothetical protein
MIAYQGWRDEAATHVIKLTGDVPLLDLPWRLDLDNHSPTGLNWGYGGSGPAQLALALIADATGDDAKAIKLHQLFKFRLIANLPDKWTLSREQVLAALEAVEREAQQ